MSEQPTTAPTPSFRDRHSPRIRGYDYGLPGAYFVTICTFNRVCLFGHVCGDRMHLNAPGHAVADTWRTIPTHHPAIELDVFVVMPNHMHGLLNIVEDRDQMTTGTLAQSITTIVGQFKAEATRAIHAIQGYDSVRVWQRSFFDHVVRTENALDRVRQYIEDNPARWGEDKENPQYGGNRKHV